MMYQRDEQQKWVPLTTLFTYIILISSAISNIFFNNWANDHFQCKRQQIMNKYQIWRLLTSVFNQPSYIGLIWVLLLTYSFISKIQRRNGTVVPFVLILVYTMGFNVVIQIILIVSYYVSTYIFDETFTFQIKTGILCVWLNILYKFYYFNRNSSLTILNIRPIAIPYIVLISIMILDREIRYDGIFGLATAILECLILNTGLIGFTQQTYTKKEDLANTLRLTKLCCWYRLNPSKLVLGEIAVVIERQFYEDLDPINNAGYEVYSVDKQRIYQNPYNQIERQKSYEQIDE